MQGQPLLSPKFRRNESINNGRRIFLVSSFVFIVLAFLAVYYGPSSSPTLRSYVSTSGAQISEAVSRVYSKSGNRKIGAGEDEDESAEPLPRLKPKSEQESESEKEAPVGGAKTEGSGSSALELTTEKEVEAGAVTQLDESKEEDEKIAENKEKEDGEVESSLATQQQESDDEDARLPIKPESEEVKEEVEVKGENKQKKGDEEGKEVKLGKKEKERKVDKEDEEITTHGGDHGKEKLEEENAEVTVKEVVAEEGVNTKKLLKKDSEEDLTKEDDDEEENSAKKAKGDNEAKLVVKVEGGGEESTATAEKEEGRAKLTKKDKPKKLEKKDEDDEEVEKKGTKDKKKKKTKSADEDSTNVPTDGKELDKFPVCDPELSEVIPCLDHATHKKMKLKLKTRLMEHYERHCPTSEFRMRCLIAPPSDYKVPIRWPKSRDWVWKANVPHTFLATEKSDQRWMLVEGEKINFPGGGTHFHDGADKYIESLAKMLGNEEGDLSLGGKIRQVLDIGCGVASFGGYLLAQNIIAMSVAPNDIHQNQIQFALERGIPAWLGVLGTLRLPYPSKAFELAHCSRCRIEWGQRDGILLIELDRLLRPGGYWAWSAPPAYRDDEESKALWKDVKAVTDKLCWTIAAHDGQTVIFQKPVDGECIAKRKKADPPLCPASTSSDLSSYVPMETCISGALLEDETWALAPWPARIQTPPARLSEVGVSEKAFKRDTTVWKARVEKYYELLGDRVEEDAIRNVLDMKGGLGGFAAALSSKPVWVMSTVEPDQASDTLKIIYDRGFLGLYHDWCEEFSTYPRTYDLLHAYQILSYVSEKCSVDDLLLEMDRILRPKAFIIFRDTPELIAKVESRVDALRWEIFSPAEVAQEDSLSKVEEKIMIVQRTLWFQESA